MRVLVTGATGLLGQAIFAEPGEHELLGLSRHEQPGPDYLIGDILDDEGLASAMSGCQAVIHAAGLVSHRADQAERLWQVNVVGTSKVLAAARAAGVRRVVHISSSGTVAVSRSHAALADETTETPLQTLCRWPYYRSKLYAEQLALAEANSELEVLSLNPSLLLGPGDVHGRSTGVVVSFLAGQVPLCPRGGLSFADARDVAATALTALTAGRSGQRYLLGAANMSFRRFYDELARLTGRSAPRLQAPRGTWRVLRALGGLGITEHHLGLPSSRAELEMSCHTWYLDDTKARSELAWSPRDTTRTLLDTVEDLQARGVVDLSTSAP